MAIKDIATKMDNKIVFQGAITTDTTTSGDIIDTADFEAGFMIIPLCIAFSAGSFEFKIYESDDSGMAGAVEVDSTKIIGTLPTLTAQTSSNTTVLGVGVFSNLRYLQIRVVSTGTANGTILAMAVQESEFQPVE